MKQQPRNYSGFAKKSVFSKDAKGTKNLTYTPNNAYSERRADSLNPQPNSKLPNHDAESSTKTQVMRKLSEKHLPSHTGDKKYHDHEI